MKNAIKPHKDRLSSREGLLLLALLILLTIVIDNLKF